MSKRTKLPVCKRAIELRQLWYQAAKDKNGTKNENLINTLAARDLYIAHFHTCQTCRERQETLTAIAKGTKYPDLEDF